MRTQAIQVAAANCVAKIFLRNKYLCQSYGRNVAEATATAVQISLDASKTDTEASVNHLQFLEAALKLFVCLMVSPGGVISTNQSQICKLLMRNDNEMLVSSENHKNAIAAACMLMSGDPAVCEVMAHNAGVRALATCAQENETTITALSRFLSFDDCVSQLVELQSQAGRHGTNPVFLDSKGALMQFLTYVYVSSEDDAGKIQRTGSGFWSSSGSTCVLDTICEDFRMFSECDLDDAGEIGKHVFSATAPLLFNIVQIVQLERLSESDQIFGGCATASLPLCLSLRFHGVDCVVFSAFWSLTKVLLPSQR